MFITPTLSSRARTHLTPPPSVTVRPHRPDTRLHSCILVHSLLHSHIHTHTPFSHSVNSPSTRRERQRSSGNTSECRVASDQRTLDGEAWTTPRRPSSSLFPSTFISTTFPPGVRCRGCSGGHLVGGGDGVLAGVSTSLMMVAIDKVQEGV
jgi:hypothetical protein